MSRRVVLTIIVLLGAVACSAQDLNPDNPLTTELVKTGLYLISGEGGNALLRLSANGLILVDGERPGDYGAVLEQVKDISDQPVRVRLHTDGRKDHSDNYTLRMGRIEVQSMHFANVHAGGDTVLYFPNLKVIAVGDLFAPTPDADFSAGGNLPDWSAALAQILKLDFDVVVPSKGPMVSRADLEVLKATVEIGSIRAPL